MRCGVQPLPGGRPPRADRRAVSNPSTSAPLRRRS